MRARRWIQGTALAVAAALGLAGCAFGDPEASAGNDDGGSTLVAATGAVPHLNPQIMVSPSVNNVAGNILETLVRMNDSYEILPWLAQDWETSEDGLTVTLNLQEGVNWHDGEPFTSEDVKFNFEEVMPYQSYGGPLTESVGSIETPDDTTVVVNLTEPYGPFMQVLSLQYLLPKHVYEGTDITQNEANMAPVGTGAFVFESFTEGDEVTMTKNPDYWKGDVGVDRLVWKSMSDTNATASALIAGEVHIGGAGQGMLDQIEADPDLGTSQNGQQPREFMFTMNAAKTPELAEPDVRSLIYAAVDKKEITEKVLPGRSEVPRSMYSEDLAWIGSEVDYTEQFAYDPEAIGQAFDELGYPVGDDGHRFTIGLTFMSTTSESKALAQVLKAQFERVGINLDLQGQDIAVFTDTVYKKREFDLAIVESTLGVDPSLGITRWYECNEEKLEAQNPSGVCDDQIQQAADRALRAGTQDERAVAFRDLQDRAVELMFAGPLTFHRATGVFNQAMWEGLGSPDHLWGTDWTKVHPKE